MTPVQRCAGYTIFTDTVRIINGEFINILTTKENVTL